MSKSLQAQIDDIAAQGVSDLPPEQLYPEWDKEKHNRMKGKVRYTGAGGTVYPEDIGSPYHCHPNLQRQICHGCNTKNEPVWRPLPDKPHPEFQGLDARKVMRNDDYEDFPIPYDKELPAYADASSVDIENFDANNPVGVASRDASRDGEYAGAVDHFNSFLPNGDSEQPAE